jgi:hypothetical protein
LSIGGNRIRPYITAYVEGAVSELMKLKYNREGLFKIVQFTDVHRTYGLEADQAAMSLMEEVLDRERPDLVVYSGDLVSGNSITKHGRGDTRKIIREVVDPADRRTIPWAVTFGNHDGQGNATNAELLAALRESPYCLAEEGPGQVSGVGNYALRVYAAEADTPAAALYCFDSGDKAASGGWAWIQRDQIDWYVRESQELERSVGKLLPALAFFHIPLPEYNEVWDHHVCYGTKWEKVCCPDLNSGLFAAMVERGDVMATFAGHDHTNDYYGDLHGIRLTYGRSTGGYSKNNFAHGARVILLREGERRFDSWIRLPGDTVIRHQPEHIPEGRV